MCQLRAWTKPRRDLSLDEFKGIVNQFPGIAGIKLQGMGEPLLNAELIDMVRWADRKNIRVRTVTNGMLMDASMAKSLVSSGLDSLYISVDSATPDIYSEIRRGADLHQVVDNIRTIVKVRGRQRHPHIRLVMLGMECNRGELPDMLRLARELSVDELTFQPNLNYYAKAPMEAELQNERLSLQEVRSIVSEGQACASKLGVKFSVDVYDSPCNWPWTSCYVSVDGFVVPCCHLADPDVEHFGNLFEVTFSQIWNGLHYKSFRKALREGPIPKCCEGCYSFSSVTPELRACLQELGCGIS